MELMNKYFKVQKQYINYGIVVVYKRSLEKRVLCDECANELIEGDLVHISFRSKQWEINHISHYNAELT